MAAWVRSLGLAVSGGPRGAQFKSIREQALRIASMRIHDAVGSCKPTEWIVQTIIKDQRPRFGHTPSLWAAPEDGHDEKVVGHCCRTGARLSLPSAESMRFR